MGTISGPAHITSGFYNVTSGDGSNITSVSATFTFNTVPAASNGHATYFVALQPWGNTGNTGINPALWNQANQTYMGLHTPGPVWSLTSSTQGSVDGATWSTGAVPSGVNSGAYSDGGTSYRVYSSVPLTNGSTYTLTESFQGTTLNYYITDAQGVTTKYGSMQNMGISYFPSSYGFSIFTEYTSSTIDTSQQPQIDVTASNFQVNGHASGAGVSYWQAQNNYTNVGAQFAEEFGANYYEVATGAGNNVVALAGTNMTIQGNGAGATLRLTATNHDLTTDTISGIAILDLNGQSATMTMAQYQSFSSLLNGTTVILSDTGNAVTVSIGTVSGPVVTNTTSNQVTLVAPTANSTVTGGGKDILNLAQNPIANVSSAYTMTSSPDGSISLAAGGSSDHVSGVIQIQFSDKTISIANSDNANVARLYQAAFGRAPDASGLAAWETVYSAVSGAAKAAGTTTALAMTPVAGLSNIASGFTNSAEFQAKYGTLNNDDFLTQIYNNVLGRVADTGGYNAWLNAMNTGGYTKEMVLVGFAESTENITNTNYSASHATGWLFGV